MLQVRQEPESQKLLPQPALAAAGEVGRRASAAVTRGNGEGAASPNPTRGGAFEVRGLALLSQWKDLVHEVAEAKSIEARIRAFEALNAWELAREAGDWDLIDGAQRMAEKAGLRAVAALLEDVSPIGQRR